MAVERCKAALVLIAKTLWGLDETKVEFDRAKLDCWHMYLHVMH